MSRKLLSSIVPGDVIEYDYRNSQKSRQEKQNINEWSSSSSHSSEQLLPSTFRFVQWNIERGMALEEVITALQACAADIIVLQELDISCRRSNYVNVPKCIAQALHAHLLFVCEFIELDDVKRSELNAVGPLSAHGTAMTSSTEINNTSVNSKPTLPPKLQILYEEGKLRHLHGNAILSTSATLTEPVIIRHYAGVDWSVIGEVVHEPRIGYRCTLRVTLNALAEDMTNDISNCNHTKGIIDSNNIGCSEDKKDITVRHSVGKLYIYNCHFEIFCGMLSRVRQLGEVMGNAQVLLTEHTTTHTNNIHEENIEPGFIIAGDFNTIAHGIARLSRYCAADRMRWLSWGETEACWLQRKVLSRHMRHFNWTLENIEKHKRCNDEAQNREECSGYWLRIVRVAKVILHNICVLYDSICNSTFVWKYIYGFSADEIHALNNTSLCLYDAMDKYQSITLNNRDYHNFVQGKLDWVLMSHCTLISPYDIMVPCMNNENSGNNQNVTPLQEPAALHKCNECALPDIHIPCNGYVLFNNDYSASDHKGILVGVKYCSKSARDCLGMAKCKHQTSMYTSSNFAKSCFVLSRISVFTLLATCAAVACKAILCSRKA